MAFRALPVHEPKGRGPLTVPTIAVHGGNQNVLCIPRELLRASGLTDIPGGSLDVLVGEGDDAGKIALIDGPRYRLITTSNTKAPKTLRISPQLGEGRFQAKPCEFEAGRRQLIITLPAGFPLRSHSTETPGAAAAVAPVVHAHQYAAE
jgi:hypothetical protein